MRLPRPVYVRMAFADLRLGEDQGPGRGGCVTALCGAKAFISFFPFVVVAGAFVPVRVRQSIASTLSSRFELSGTSATTVTEAFTSSDDSRKATGVLGLVFLAYYATSFTTALQRVFLRAWRRPAGGQVTNRLHGPAWLGGIIAVAAWLGRLRRVLGGGPGAAVFLAVRAALAVGLCWATGWLILQGQVRWRAPLPMALITGLGLSIYALSASRWMPHTVASDQRQITPPMPEVPAGHMVRR